MLEMLLKNEWFYVALSAIVLIFIIWILCKYKGSRIYVFSFLGIALIAFTIFSIIQLDIYYSARGGIFGYIGDIFSSNMVEIKVTENIEVSLANIEMTKESDEEYSATIMTHDIIAELGVGEKYYIEVNGTPVTSVNYASQYVKAEYEYSFLDKDFEELFHDTLFINFAFYNTGTSVEVYTLGGEEAKEYWQHYFSKQKFDIQIYKSPFSENIEIIDNEVDESGLIVVKFFSKDELIGVSYSTEPFWVESPAITDDTFIIQTTSRKWLQIRLVKQ